MSIQTDDSNRLLARLSVGFSAEIWKCERRSPNGANLTAAMRIYHGSSTDEKCRQQLARLRRIVSLQDIPGLPEYWDIGVWMDRLYALTALADGDCSKLIEAPSRSEETFHPRVLELVGDAAICLDTLRERGLVHGGVAPQHILMLKDRAVLAGFSLLHPFGSRVPDSANVDLLTWFCMSPEMRDGDASAASDQFGLAAAYLAMRIGRLPIGDSSWPHGFLSTLGHDEASVLSRSLAASPKQRFTCCVEFANELRGATQSAN